MASGEQRSNIVSCQEGASEDHVSCVYNDLAEQIGGIYKAAAEVVTYVANALGTASMNLSATHYAFGDT